MRRRAWMVLSAVLSLGVLLAPIVGEGPATAVSGRLPDLRIAKLTTIKQDTTTIPGHRLLRYTSTIVNVGVGHVEVEGTRPDTATPTMTVTQRIYADNGIDWTDVPTGTRAFWAGDGHNHWHLFEMAGAVLTPFGRGAHVGTSAQEGFHFSDDTPFDLSLPNAPQTKRYKSCLGNTSCKPDALFIAEGIAVGWGNLYRAGIMFQWIDITGVANGKYVLTVTADPHGYLQESDNTNNTASATIRITSTSVNVLSYSGGA
jgi:Lysyl oxidase